MPEVYLIKILSSYVVACNSEFLQRSRTCKSFISFCIVILKHNFSMSDSVIFLNAQIMPDFFFMKVFRFGRCCYSGDPRYRARIRSTAPHCCSKQSLYRRERKSSLNKTCSDVVKSKECMNRWIVFGDYTF